MVKTRIYAGLAFMVVFGVLSMLYIYHGLGHVAGYLDKLGEFEVPFSLAATEMEKNTDEYAFGVMRYIEHPHPDIRAETGKDAADFSRSLATYMRVSTSGKKRGVGRHLAEEQQRLAATAEALMQKRDHLNAVFAQVTDLLEAIDRIVDEQMPSAMPDGEPARSRTRATIANIEAEAAEVGFWLSAHERKPTAQARRRVSEKQLELANALSEYLHLPLGAHARQLGLEARQLQAKAGGGIDELLAGGVAINELVGQLVSIHAHMDDVFDGEVESLKQEGLTEPREQADLAAKQVLVALRYVIPLYVLLTLTGGWLLVRAIVRPLRRLALGTRAIGAGDLEYRIVEQGKDEFEDLARQFNRMVAQLQESTVSRGLLEASEQKLQRTVAELRQEIEEHQRSERAREKLQAELRRSEAMAAMGTLMAGVAHEVRNPLFGISSTLDAMDASQSGNGVGSRYREVLRREVIRLNKLMTDLLEYGRPPTSELTVGRLDKIVVEAIRICTPAAAAGDVAIVNRVAADDVMLRMNHDRLLQVFVNLIENAVQHAPPETHVTIDAQTTAETGGQCWIECGIKDSGPGFAPEDLPLVFDPFFTRRRKGTGLGLAIVQRIVEEHSGTIVPSNRPEGGAVMTMRLPSEYTAK